MWVILLIPIGAFLLFVVGCGLLVVPSVVPVWQTMPRGKRARLSLTLSGLAIFFAAIGNGITFGVESLYYGGSARSGKIEDGLHYVVNHGDFTEVSENTFNYLYAHETGTFRIGFPLGVIGFATALLLSHLEKSKATSNVLPPPET